MRLLLRWMIRICLINALTIIGAHASSKPKEAEGGGEAGASEYMDIKPALITNFGGAGPIHFLKAEITLRVGVSSENHEAVAHHMPRIRHELIMLLSRQSGTDLETMEGKEKLRKDALTAIQKFMEVETGKKTVDDLLFNNFVIQR
ncbi:MAG: flagellar basal body-associated FliL family protein [Spongiibacteraceae bacterium]